MIPVPESPMDELHNDLERRRASYRVESSQPEDWCMVTELAPFDPARFGRCRDVRTWLLDYRGTVLLSEIL